MADFGNKEIVESIARVAARVMMVALPVDATMPLSHTEAAETLQQDVETVLRMQEYPPVYIDEHANWSPLLRRGDDKARIIFIALVLGIYE